MKYGWDITDVVYEQEKFRGLPKEFEFREDSDFLYVYRNDELVGVYQSKYVNVDMLVDELMRRRWKDDCCGA